MNIFDFATTIGQEISFKLPGIEAHRKVTPKARMPLDYKPNPAGAKQSAVAVLCFEKEGQICTILFKRTEDGSPHSGQISFPGGKAEPNDNDLTATALRETEEELGIEQKLIHTIDLLTPLYIPVSNFSVQPVLGFLKEEPNFTPNPHEVQEVIVAPLEELFDPKNQFVKRFTRDNYSFDAQCINTNGHTVWGATAIILAEVQELYFRSKKSLHL